MGIKIRKITLAALAAGSAVLLVAPAAEANRGNGTTTTTQGYVPTYGQNPQPEVAEEPNPYANPVAPTVVPTDLPAVTDPNAGGAGEGERLGPAPSNESTVPSESDTRPEAPADDGGVIGGILSRTGAETLPLARAGLGALALGIGLVILTRRRRVEAASA